VSVRQVSSPALRRQLPLCPDCQERLERLADCARCGWRYETVDGIPSLLSTADRSSPLFNLYVANYLKIAEDDLAHSIQRPEHLAAQASTLRSYLGDVGGRRVCEIGVGQGLLFDELLVARPVRLVGVDVASAYLRPYATRAEVFVANAENLPFKRAFDLVVASEVLEHVLNVGDFLLSTRRSLVDGGELAVRVPYRENLLPYARRLDCPYDLVHLRTFTADSLVSLLGHAGFRLKRLVYDGCYAYRMRPWARALPDFALRRYLSRVYAGRTTGSAVDNAAARLLFTPATLTAIFERTPRKAGRKRRSGRS